MSRLRELYGVLVLTFGVVGISLDDSNVVRFCRETKTAASTSDDCLFGDDSKSKAGPVSGTDKARFQVMGQMAGFVEEQIDNEDIGPPYFCYGMLSNVLVSTVYYCDSIELPDGTRVFRFVQLLPHDRKPHSAALCMGDFKASKATRADRTKVLLDAWKLIDASRLSQYYTLTRQVARMAAKGPFLDPDAIPSSLRPRDIGPLSAQEAVARAATPSPPRSAGSVSVRTRLAGLHLSTAFVASSPCPVSPVRFATAPDLATAGSKHVTLS